MADTTVTVETPDDDTETHTEDATDSASASASVDAATTAAENKAHSEHAAAEATEAANLAKDRSQEAEWSATNARDALAGISDIAASIVGAVNSIPEKIAEALGGMTAAPAEESTVAEVIEEPEALAPATPPSRRRVRDWYYGNKGGN